MARGVLSRSPFELPHEGRRGQIQRARALLGFLACGRPIEATLAKDLAVSITLLLRAGVGVVTGR